MEPDEGDAPSYQVYKTSTSLSMFIRRNGGRQRARFSAGFHRPICFRNSADALSVYLPERVFDSIYMNMSLHEILKSSSHVVAFTGAGLSTDSGIPDFRSSSGLYSTGEFEGKKPEDILSRRFFKSNPSMFTSFYQQRIMSMRDKKPNRSHYALKNLQDMGKLKTIVNQNIDNLLQSAGVQRVLDLHGNITSFRCVSCCRPFTQEDYVTFKGTPYCGCGGVVRPNTVLFDESLNDDVFDTAHFEMSSADVVIVIGSSLLVQPACSLLDVIREDCTLVIINKQETPYDGRANLILRDPCSDVLESTVKSLT